MSFYSFIATNYEIPEVDNTNVKYITVKEAIELELESPYMPFDEMDPDAQVLLCENENDLDELVITEETTFGDCGFTNHPFIYQLDFAYSIKRVNQLLEYLKENIKEGQLLEIWRVWISNDMGELYIPFSRCSFEELSLNHLLQIYDRQHEQYKEQCCLVIDR